MKKLLSVLLALLMVFALVGCGQKEEAGGSETTETNLVGVSMPTKDLQRWNQDGSNMEKELKAAGYEVDLEYANNDEATQISQIENMINQGAKVLVISAINGESLTGVLAGAKEKGIAVIAYDRLIMSTDAVTYYATFDNYKVGTLQGKFIEDALKLTEDDGKTYNIEFRAGDPGDNNAGFFFNGAYDVLGPYVESGKLVNLSGQHEFAQVATDKWDSTVAQKNMEAILNSYYPAGTVLDAVCCSNDSTAFGTLTALDAIYTPSHDNTPIVTGQDCDLANVPHIIDGTQAMAVFKDTRTLASKVVGMVDAIMQGTEPEINDTKTYNNGTKVVPSFLCDPIVCTAENYKEILLDSGYYKLDGDKIVAND